MKFFGFYDANTFTSHKIQADSANEAYSLAEDTQKKLSCHNTIWYAEFGGWNNFEDVTKNCIEVSEADAPISIHFLDGTVRYFVYN